MSAHTWWRRERRAVALLPVAVVLALVATSSRVNEYWWARGFHDPASTISAGAVRVDDFYDDGVVQYPIRAEVSLQSARPITRVPGSSRDLTAPTGAQVWEVRLRWSAEPDVALVGCQLALIDRDGVRYDATIAGFDPRGSTPLQMCVPDDTPGPRPSFDTDTPPAITPGEDARPPAYATRAYVVVPTEIVPVAVRIWWFLPRYAELSID